jgi:DNA polymerase III subunit delta'
MPFRDITGHRNLLDLLARAAGRGSLPPSLILAGPEGVGKRMAALALAQLLNCQAPSATADPPDACGECASCRRIARGVHADVLVLEPGDTGTIKIDQIREAVERSAYRPFEGRRRVVIVDDADAMVPDAQNALLKTLEEPPPSSVFVLVTARPDMLLITVRSRCQRLRFGRLSPADVAGVLVREHDFAEGDARAAAAAADGSVGLALEGGTEDVVAAREAAVGLLEHVAGTRDPRRRLAGAQALLGTGKRAADRQELTRRLQAVSSILRDVGVLVSGADDQALANADLRPLLDKLHRSFDRDRALSAYAAVDRALVALDRNGSVKIVADWVSMKI